MTDVVCGGCASPQPAGTQYCGVCGREFPRTGRPPVPVDPGPRSAVQQQAGSYGGGGELPYHQGGGYQDDEFQTGTFVPEREPAPVSSEPVPVYAHVGRRIVALLIDGGVGGALFGIVYGIALLMAQPPEGMVAIDENEARALVMTLMVGLWVGIGLMVLWSLAMLIWEARTGKTLGNVALGIRTLSAEDQNPIGFWRVVLRMLVVGAGSIACGIGTWVVLLSPLWDAGGRRQGWHDKAARAVVIDIKKKPAPEVAGFHPEARPASAPAPAPAPAPVQGGLTPAQGPAGPGALRAAGQGHAAASAAHQSAQRSAAAQAPTASFTPEGSAPAANRDPWSFPTGQPAEGGGLITDVPGAPGAFSPQAPGAGQDPAGGAPSAAQQPAQPPAQQPPAEQPGPPASSYPADQPTASTPSPPATPNSARPITAANTIPDHPVMETSPYPPISQPQHRESQPTRAANIDQIGQAARQAQQPQPSREAAPQPRPAAPPQPAAPQESASTGRHAAAPDGDDATRIEPMSGSTQLHTGGAMVPPVVTGVVLELESGQSVRVDGPTLVGRNPQAPGSTGVNLVQIADPMRSVSKNHAELGVDSAGLWLTDRGSTNGTVVSVPGLPPRVAEPGARVRVPVGSTIHFGDRRVVVHPSSGDE